MTKLNEIYRNLTAISGGDVAAFERTTATFTSAVTFHDSIPHTVQKGDRGGGVTQEVKNNPQPTNSKKGGKSGI